VTQDIETKLEINSNYFKHRQVLLVSQSQNKKYSVWYTGNPLQ